PALWMRGGGQEAVHGIVARADVRMRQSGRYREVAPQVPEDLQVGRELVVLAGFLREEKRRMQAQRRADAHHAPARPGGSGERERGSQRFEPGQGQRHAGGLEKIASVKLHGRVLTRLSVQWGQGAWVTQPVATRDSCRAVHACSRYNASRAS